MHKKEELGKLFKEKTVIKIQFMFVSQLYVFSFIQSRFHFVTMELDYCKKVP